jgi:hypothetical protein
MGADPSPMLVPVTPSIALGPVAAHAIARLLNLEFVVLLRRSASGTIAMQEAGECSLY